MTASTLRGAVEKFHSLVPMIGDEKLDITWVWGPHDEEGVRFAFLRTYQELRELAANITAERSARGPAITLAQAILAQHHLAYLDLMGVLCGVRDDELDRVPKEGEWPLREVLWHIVRTETNFTFLIEFAAEQARTGNPVREAEDADRAEYLKRPQYKYVETKGGTLAETLARYEHIHSFVMETFSAFSDADVSAVSLWWEEMPFPARHRMHRYAAHLAQHTIQAEKTLAWLGHPPTETEHLMRQLYGGLALAEGALLGAPDVLKAEQEEVAAVISARADEIAALLR
jgi:hypothetical protein